MSKTWIVLLLGFLAVCANCGKTSTEQLVMPEPFGFGIPKIIHAGIISIDYKTPQKTTARNDRNTAAKLAVDLKKKLDSGEITFEEAARKYSDNPFADKGGDLGYVRIEDVAHIEGSALLFTQKSGELSKVIELDGTFLLFKTLPFERKYYRMICVNFGEESVKKRTREQALSEMTEIYQDIVGGRTTFEHAADQKSDLASGPGGYIGLVIPGTRGEKFDKASMTLKIGTLSDIYEEKNYFALIKRSEQVFYTFTYIVFLGNTDNVEIRKDLISRAEECLRSHISREDFYEFALKHFSNIRWDEPWYKVSKDLFTDNLHRDLLEFLRDTAPGDVSKPVVFTNGVYVFMKEEPIRGRDG